MSQRTVLIAGGSGLIGQRLTDRLVDQGDCVHILSRSPRSDERASVKYFKWDLESSYIDQEAWNGVTDLVQLTGATISDHKWTDDYKKVLVSSRIDSTALLVRSLNEHSIELDHVYAASAIGIYGNRPGREILTTESDPGTCFTADLVQKWEDAGSKLKEFSQQHTIMRIGLVLDREDGFLSKFTPGLKLLTVPYFGRGDQFFSWIHIEDLVSYILWSMDKALSDVINLVAPNPVSSKDFARAVGDASPLPAIPISVPDIFIKWAFGQRSEVILMGNNVKPEHLLDLGFPYRFPDIKTALQDLL